MKRTFFEGLIASLVLVAGCGSDSGSGIDASSHLDTGADTGAGGTGMAGTGGGGVSGGTGGGGDNDAAIADGPAAGGAGGGGADGAGSGGTDGGDTWLTPPIVPPALAVPAGATLKIHDHAVGAQVYTCTASGSPAGGVDAGTWTYAWVLKAPDAKLYDKGNTQVGTHGAGPNWTSTVDGSVVNGAKVAQVDAPVSSAIPWLLLRASSTSGTGAFSDITYVQRVNTANGKAPASGCDATAVGTEVRIDYSADYYFYTGGAGTAWLSPPQSIPAAIAVPAGATLKLHDHAIGVQIYTRTASGGGDAGAMVYTWVLKAPDAILYDAVLSPVGTHGVGPNWTSTDGSVVNGTKLQQSDAASSDAIPWLLLKAASTSGSGVFTDVAYVQRLNTAGGKAPSTGCDATTASSETRINYSADYYFYTAAPGDGGTSG